jgi:hypothetical protein
MGIFDFLINDTVNKNDVKYFYYSKRYKSISEKVIIVKGLIIKFIVMKYKKYHPCKSSNGFFFLKNSFSYVLKNDNSYYKDISLKNVSFFEIINLDDFDSFRKNIILRFKNMSTDFGEKYGDSLQKKLYKLENEFNSCSSGNLININIKKNRTNKNDLFDFICVDYIKTNESYFILCFKINLSEKAQNIFKNIIQQEDATLHIPNLNHFWRYIIKNLYCSVLIRDLKENSIENLISDLKYQLKNITGYLSEFFSENKILSCIELFEIDDMNEFNKYRNRFIDYFDYYENDDKKIKICLPSTSKDKYNVIQIIKEKGHGNKELKSIKDSTDYDYLENYDLMYSMSLPCVFSSILDEQRSALNMFKREMYFHAKKSKYNIISLRKYLKIKYKLSQILLTAKKLKTDFNKNLIYLIAENGYSNSFDLQNFLNKRNEKLMDNFIKDINAQIRFLKIESGELNGVFKSFEEYNITKTNFRLQKISIFIGVSIFIITIIALIITKCGC